MRSLHIIHSINSVTGGPAQFVRQVLALNTLARAEITVLSLDTPDAPWVKTYPKKVEALATRASNYGFAPALPNWLKEHRNDYDIAIVHGIWQYHSLATWHALKALGKPYVVFPHGMLDPWFKERYPFKHVKKYLYWLCFESKIIKDAAAVLFTTEDECLRSRNSFSPYTAREVIVGLGVQAPTGDAVKQQEIFREQFPDLANKRLLLFLGRLHEKKGCYLLLRAFAQIAKSDLQLHLVMAGPSTAGYSERLQKEFTAPGKPLHGRVTWTGMLDGDLKWGALRSAEAFILPSHQENFGMAVAESLACGTPVLISDRVNTWREIVEAQAGFVEPDDVSGTANLLTRWLGLSEEEKSELSKNALLCFEKNFEINKMYDRLSLQLQEILDSGRS